MRRDTGFFLVSHLDEFLFQPEDFPICYNALQAIFFLLHLLEKENN